VFRMEKTQTINVVGTAEFLVHDGSNPAEWRALVLSAFAPEQDGFAYQVPGEPEGWVPADCVRSFSPARPLPEARPCHEDQAPSEHVQA
jgi:hypothetical protein